MRSIKKQFALWSIALVIGMAAIAIAIPIAARVSPTEIVVVNERQAYVESQAGAANKVADANDSSDSKATTGKRVGRPQDYYDRRRAYWEDRMDGRMKDLDEEEAGADSEDTEDSGADDDEEA